MASSSRPASPEPAAAPDDPAAHYASRHAGLTTEYERIARLAARLGPARALAFAGVVAAAVIAAWPRSPAPRAAGIVAVVLALVFVALVAWQARLARRLRWIAALRDVNADGVARLARDWAALAEPVSAAPADHPYARDLGITGPGSLMHLLGGAASPLGRRRLEGWLLAPAAPDVVALRQQAVADLAPRTALREQLQAHGRLLEGLTPERYGRLLAWAEQDAPRFGPMRSAVAATLAAAIIASVVLQAAGIIRLPLWLVLIPFGWLLTARWARGAHADFGRADPGPGFFAQYPPLFELVAGERFTAPALAELHALLSDGAPAAALRRLERLVAFADARHMWLHVVLQSLTLWDLHLVGAFERWRRRHGGALRRRLDALVELDALGALAALRYEHPAWAAPLLDPGADRLEAVALAHPLLHPDTAVPNDVTLGPAGSLLLVTGSNMSGKSTLLRAVGLNAVLAQAGGPVFAARFRLPPVTVVTSMRVEDSLTAGVSLFLAELRRLRQVVAAAESGGPPALCLLDEILQGTNSAERQVAARHVLDRLLGTPALVAASTHDLALAGAPELSSRTRAVHFQETIVPADGGERMTFDYRLRPGVATSVNALRLMRMVGL